MNITLLIFSYNRAMQLDAVLRSLLRHCQDVSHAGVHVLYKADDRHMGSYQQLRRDYSQYSWIHFIKENTFHQDLIQCMDDSENILFLVDDNLFTRDFKLHHYVEALQSRERVIGVSLRLGRNTTYCYPLDQKQSIPIFTPLIQGDLFFYSWSGCDHDYGYPLEVSSSIYRVTDIQTILGQNPVQNPNHFETLLSEHANQIKDRYPELICPRQSITFCIPVNKVQSVIKENRAGEKYAYSSDELLELFQDGYRIWVEGYDGYTPDACHQEVPLVFSHPSEKPRLGLPPESSLSEIIPLRRELQDLVLVMEKEDGISLKTHPEMMEAIHRYNWAFEDQVALVKLALAMHRLNANHGIRALDDLMHRKHNEWRFKAFTDDNWALIQQAVTGDREPGPLVSVIMPVYNGEKYLGEALDSILNQTFQDFECIIIDDGSTDRTEKIIQSYSDSRICYVKNEQNSGIVTTLNHGLALAKGKYIARADADDISFPKRLAIQVEMMENNPHLVLTGSSMITINPAGKVVGEEIVPVEENQIIRRLVLSNAFVHPSVMVRAEAIRRVGGYLSDRNHAEDYDLWCRLNLNFPGTQRNYDGHLIKYRLNEASICHRHWEAQQEIARHIGRNYVKYKLGLKIPEDVYHGISQAWLGDWSLWMKEYTVTLKDFLDWIKIEPVVQHRWKVFFNQLESINEVGQSGNRPNTQDFRVIAIMSAYNEADVIHHVIKDLVDQGIQVYFIDHHSTDDTVAIVSRFLGKGVLKIETFPEESGFDVPPDVYAWRFILKRKEDIAKSLGPGWYMHIDADEFRESPWQGVSLIDGIRKVDEQGYNAIEFKIFDFKPVNNDFIPGSDVRKALRFYSHPNHQSDTIQLKCWKYYGQDFNLWRSGGHIIEFNGRRVFPTPFIMRHYPIRSQQHGLQKVFNERKNRFDEYEKKNEWHAQYDFIKDQKHKFIQDPKVLITYDGKLARRSLKGRSYFIEDKRPLVSVIIPVFNKLELTHACFKSIIQNTQYPNYELIFVDNNSTDGTTEYLRKLAERGIRSFTLDENIGFTLACNLGAEKANGEYLLFLNNDTEVTPGWLTSLVRLARERKNCGAVGSKLVYPNGKLQEAGGIIFSDGSGWNYGRGLSPAHPAFNFVREVDYCSGAALMIKADLWQQIGGFDERYAPAYYEDTDLCFAVRQAGYKVYYQPESVVVHHEGQTAGTDLNSGLKKYQQINAAKFVEKWQAELSKQYAPGAANVMAASQRGVRGSIFIADPLLPSYDRASGSLRLFSYIKILREMGYHITYMARVLAPDVKYIRDLQNIGVEVWGNDGEALKMAGFKLNREFPPINYDLIFKPREFDYAILSFWYIAQYYMPLLRRITPKTKIIVDTVDIHFIREIREAELKQDPKLKQVARQKQKKELAVYNQADELWVVTENDRQSIAPKIDKIPIDIIPNIHSLPLIEKTFDQTADLLFVGNFTHTPNVDAVLHFHRNMWPSIQTKLPDIKWYVVGNNPPDVIKNLADERVIVTGYVEDLAPYLQKARISISPLRYGAGMKGKIGEALSWWLPVVTTTIGAEGMNLEHRKNALVADSPKDFVKCILDLYRDQTLWASLAEAGRDLVERNWSTERIRELMRKKFNEEDSNGSDTDKPPLVSIILLTWNALEYTQKCIKSIEQNTHIPFEIIIVDNASTDGTVKYLNQLVKKHSNYKLIKNKKNRGFAAGNNQGVEAATGKYVMLLNNDVLVSKGWLKSMMGALERDEKIGAVGPLSNSISGRQSLKEIPYKDTKGFYEFAQKIHKHNENRLTPRRRLAGFAILMKKSLYEDLDGFDTTFGVGNFEDDDLSLRIREKGYALMVDESVLIHHYGSQTFKANKVDYQANMQERLKIFHKKWPDVNYKELLEMEKPLDKYLPDLLKRAEVNIHEKHYDKALDNYRTVKLYDPLNTDAAFGEIRVLMLAGHQVEALTILKGMLINDPDNTDILLETGKILRTMGLYDKAGKIFEKIIILDSKHADAKRILSEIKSVQPKDQSDVNGTAISQSIFKENRAFVNTVSEGQ